jgi:uncharacterized membrane protein
VRLPAWRTARDRLLFPEALRVSPDFTIVRRFAAVAFGLMALALLVTSAAEYSRYSLTQDFAAVHQAAHQIAHGDFNPRDSVDGLAHYWQVHFELYMWPLAILLAVFRTPFVLLLFQDACGFLACLITFRWMATMLYASPRPIPYRRLLLLSCLVVLATNPWFYWSYAFDFHTEPVVVASLVWAAYAFYLGKVRWGLAMCAAVLMGGDVASTYLVGLGASLVLAMRGRRWLGLVVAACGIIWLQFVHVIGSGLQSQFNTTYGYLVYGFFPGYEQQNLPRLTVADLLGGIFNHPMYVLFTLGDKARDIYANLAPTGLIGVLSPWAFGISALVIAENDLAYAYAYSQPIFQNMPLYIFGVAGFAWMLALLARSGLARVAAVLAVVAVVDNLGWAGVWMPALWPHWIRTPAATALAFTRIKRQIAPTDEVVATQGLVGRFADRASIYSVWYTRRVPRDADVVQFVIDPFDGVNVESVNHSLAVLDALVNRFNARVRLHDHDAWWLTVGLQNADAVYDLPPGAISVPAWACSASAAEPRTDGPASDWRAYSDHRRGYVVSRDYWRDPAGAYRASVELSSTAPVIMEVNDATTEVPILREVVPAGRRRTISRNFMNLDLGNEEIYRGFGPFQIDVVEPPIHDSLEIRIFSSGTGETSVYRLAIRPVGRVRPPTRAFAQSRAAAGTSKS